MKYADKSVDVVIPTYKPGKEFKKIIERLLRQTHHINKIIIINTMCEGYQLPDFSKYCQHSSDTLYSNVADELRGQSGEHSADNKSRLVKNRIVVHNIERSEFNHGLTRNLGISLSDAEFVVFMTQDAIPAGETLIEELIKPFEDDEVYVVYARQLPRKDCRYVERYVRSFNYPDMDIVKTKDSFDKMGIKTIFCSDVCAAYRRQAHVELGGFKETDFNEDMIFAYDAIMEGKKLYYASKAKVIHSHNYSYKQQFKRNIEIGKSQKKFDYIFGSLKSEDEGIKLLKNGIKYLLDNGKGYYIPDFILESAFKYIGFRIGRHSV